MQDYIVEPMNQIKLICLDVDGTLIDDNVKIPQCNIDEIKRAVSKGVKVAITSGRMSLSTKYFMDLIGIDGAISSLGGGMLEDENGNIIEEYFLDLEICKKIIQLANDNGITLYAYHHYEWYTDITKADPYWIDAEKRLTNVRGTLVHDLQKEVLERLCPNKMLAMHKDPEKAKAFMEYLEKELPDRSKINIFMSGKTYIELVPPQANKGNAVRGLCLYYNIPKENVMVCGDYYNDIHMFKEAAISVAAANAPDAVKKAATYVTKADNNQGVVAEAIRVFIP